VTDRGIACNECTLAKLNHPDGLDALLQKYKVVDWLNVNDNIIKCDLCQMKMEKTTNMFIMPKEIHLCSTHANRTTMRNIMNIIQQHPDADKESIIRSLNDIDQQNFDNNPANSKKHLKSLNNFAKLKSRSKRH
jgi:hypothetical protein